MSLFRLFYLSKQKSQELHRDSWDLLQLRSRRIGCGKAPDAGAGVRFLDKRRLRSRSLLFKPHNRPFSRSIFEKYTRVIGKAVAILLLCPPHRHLPRRLAVSEAHPRRGRAFPLLGNPLRGDVAFSVGLVAFERAQILLADYSRPI